MKTYFEEPTQVMFVDEEGTWQCGIAYEDYIICGCCGGIFYIDDVIGGSPDYIQQPIHEYESWVSISEEIRGGETPESFLIEVERVDHLEE